MNRKLVITAVLFLMVGIIAGAFGAHALKESISAKQLVSYETGVRYLIYHGLALLALGLSAEKLPELKWVGRLLIAGVLLFSGSIFLLALKDLLGANLSFLGPVTPIGGVLMIAGWGVLLKNLLLPKK